MEECGEISIAIDENENTVDSNPIIGLDGEESIVEDVEYHED